jgi:hypothetical protein
MKTFNLGGIYEMFNICVNVPNSPFGGNYKGNSVKSGNNPKTIAKRRAKNKNKKTYKK